MSVTFSGAFTFTGGGFTATLAPPGGVTAGWFGGGVTNFVPAPSNTSLVNRLTFATDTATASVRGPLTDGGYQLAATGTTTYGWFGGGYAYPATKYSTVSRITYTTDTATASSRGPLSANKYGVSASTDNTTYGWFAGGSLPGSTSTIDRITYATDTATATARGPLAIASQGLGATGTTSYGWFMGLYPGNGTNIQRIDYANDSATASSRGQLVTGLYRSVGAVTDGSTYGWLGAGRAAPPVNSISNVQRITYATDTGITSTRGPLTAVAYNGGATSDGTTYGWFGMGAAGNPSAKSSIITRITFATDTSTSTDRGFLSAVRYGFAGSSGNQ